jgi:hypothetical protein
METLLSKDRLQQVNPYMFAKLQANIQERQYNAIGLWSTRLLRFSFVVLLVFLVVNVFLGIRVGKQNSMQQSQQAYNEFVEENSLEGLSSYATAEFLNQK